MVQQRCVNPFFHRIAIEPKHYIPIILGSIFLAPIRLFLSVVLFFIASSLARFYDYILTFVDKSENPEKYHQWRAKLKVHLVALFRFILFICGFYKVTIVQKGDPEKEKDAPIYIFAPHTSLFDILAGVTFNAPSSVAKADIVDIPLFGNIFKLSDPILVDRNSRDSRASVFKQVADAIKHSKIVFFPEGTCSNHRVLLQFKNGAFKFGYPVIPVALRFNQYGGPDSLSWTWDGPSTLVSIWLTLARWRTDLEVTKLPVYYPTEEEKSDADLFAANVTRLLVNELRIPCLFYSYDDARYLKYKFFRSSACVKFLKLCDKIRQFRVEDSATSSVASNKNVQLSNGAVESKKKSRETLFTNFLYQYIDEINQNLKNYNLTAPLDQDRLIEALNAKSISGINNSSSVREFMLCLEKSTQPVSLLHLKLVLNLVDLRVDDLWERLRHCYETISECEKSSSMSFESLKTLLWLALNLEDVDCDVEIKDIRLLTFDDLKGLVSEHYDFALRENANSICQEAVEATRKRR